MQYVQIPFIGVYCIVLTTVDLNHSTSCAENCLQMIIINYTCTSDTAWKVAPVSHKRFDCSSKILECKLRNVVIYD
jgi:hypothetical protein